MRAGDLGRRLSVVRRVVVGKNDLNEDTFEDQVIATVWARLIHKSEDERFAAEQRYAERVVTFVARWMSLLPTDTLVCEGITYQVQGVREIGRHEGLEISAVYQQ